MAFKLNATQQLNLEDALINLPLRTRKFVEKSWAAGFSEIVFPQINEKRFAVLYSDNAATRPNTPVNAIIGAMIIKELFGLTDEDLLESILCDVRFQVALRTTSLQEQPFSDRTFSRFRERLYYHELNTVEDLLKEEMLDLAETFREYLRIEPTLKRMDSLMVASSSKKMSRLEILYTCMVNLVKQLHKKGETTLTQPVQAYLKEEHRNQVIYHQHLCSVIQDAQYLLERMPDSHKETEAYHHLVRVIQEQTCTNDQGEISAKAKKEISPQSLQNPSDPDATYRRKNGKDHKGYVANIVESTGKEGNIITAYDYQPNSHSDNTFCRKTIEDMGPQKEKTFLVADGAYASIENAVMAKANNIDLVTTSFLGKTPDEIQAYFKLDSANRKVIEYQKLAKIRNGVEGIPSVLRRKHHVDQIPVRGYLRSKLWFGFKIAAINVNRVLKKVSQDRLLPDFLKKLQEFKQNLRLNKQNLRLSA